MGGANEIPPQQPVVESGPATGFALLPASTVVAEDGPALSAILRRLRADPDCGIRAVQLLGDVVYDISALAQEFQARAFPENYLNWPNMLALGNAAIVRIAVAGVFGFADILRLVPLYSTLRVAYLENIVLEGVPTSPGVFGVGLFQPNQAATYGRFILELRRVRIRGALLYVGDPGDAPDATQLNMTVVLEECAVDLAYFMIVAALVARNSTFGAMQIDNDLAGNQTNLTLDHCVFRGLQLPGFPPLPGLISRVADAFVVAKNCRFVGQVAEAAVRVEGSGAAGGLVLQGCSFDWVNPLYVDIRNQETHLWVLDCIDFNFDGGAERIKESNPGNAATTVRAGVGNFSLANYSMIAGTLLSSQVGI